MTTITPYTASGVVISTGINVWVDVGVGVPVGDAVGVGVMLGVGVTLGVGVCVPSMSQLVLAWAMSLRRRASRSLLSGQASLM